MKRPSFLTSNSSGKVSRAGSITAIFLVVVLLAASFQESSYSTVSSSNIFHFNQWSGVSPTNFTVFCDGTTFYAMNGATGAIDYSGTSAATVLQNVINDASSKSIDLKDCTYALGTTTLTINKDGFKITGVGEDNTKFTYTGSDAAFNVTKTSGTITRVALADLQIDTTGAGSASSAIHATRYSQFAVRDVYLGGNNGYGLFLDGTGNFAAYGYFENVRIGGSFTKAIYITGPSIDANNANTFVNVNAICSGTCTNKYGMHLEDGDTNTIIGGDFEGWGTGLRMDGTLNRLIAPRFEGNTVDMNFTSGSSYNMMIGASEDATPQYVDTGSNNQRFDRFMTNIPNLNSAKSTQDNTIMTFQGRRTVTGNSMIFQTEDSSFTSLVTRLAIQGGNTTANTKVQLTNAGLDMNGNNFKGIISSSSDPTTSTIQSGEWQIVKNTTSGEVRLWYNDSGTLRSVKLSQFTTPAATTTDYRKTGNSAYFYATPFPTITNNAVAFDNIYAYPFVVTKTMTLSQLGYYVQTSAANSKGMAGIYSDSNYYPGTKLVATSEQLNNSTGLKVSSISYQLTPGLYWMVYTAGTATATIQGYQTTNSAYVQGVSPTSNIGGYKIARTYDSTLPTSFPASASGITSNADMAGVLFSVASYP